MIVFYLFYTAVIPKSKVTVIGTFAETFQPEAIEKLQVATNNIYKWTRD